MAGWKRILCPVDFSDSSRHGLLEALEIARRYAGKVVLLHVLEQGWSMARADLLAPPEFVNRLRESAASDLATWRKVADEIAPGLTVTEMIGGHPATEIARVAKEGGFDLIVMGTHGRRGLRRLVLGSVAEEVVRSAPCSVLTVRNRHDTFEVKPD